MTAAFALVGESGHPSAEALAAQWDRDRWDLRLYGYMGYPRWVRYRGRRDVAQRGATGISQRWLLGVAKEWGHRAALRGVSGSYRCRARPDLAVGDPPGEARWR